MAPGHPPHRPEPSGLQSAWKKAGKAPGGGRSVLQGRDSFKAGPPCCPHRQSRWGRAGPPSPGEGEDRPSTLWAPRGCDRRTHPPRVTMHHLNLDSPAFMGGCGQRMSWGFGAPQGAKAMRRRGDSASQPTRSVADAWGRAPFCVCAGAGVQPGNPDSAGVFGRGLGPLGLCRSGGLAIRPAGFGVLYASPASAYTTSRFVRSRRPVGGGARRLDSYRRGGRSRGPSLPAGARSGAGPRGLRSSRSACGAPRLPGGPHRRRTHLLGAAGPRSTPRAVSTLRSA